ncbi:serpin family protein [Saccharibacillus deserti]|uniref:serpin family protein n=1 Tax=Saccharibacillus deserti TaxID=1634444 RepID=UPI0015537A26|nr:serpin family protein [Saccharibacillus deserti]
MLTASGGCSNSPYPVESLSYKSTYTGKDADPKLAASMNAFALDFYAMLEKQPGEDEVGPNRMVSPAGLSIALSMLKAGAEGETERQMDRTLQLNGMSPEALNEGQKVLRDLLRGSDPSVQMAVANSLWSREGFALNPDYVSQMEENYAAQIQVLDFSSPKSVDIMNQWASDNTAGRIPKVLESPLSGDLVLLLMNAMYFKGDWTEPFEKSQTEELPFETAGGESVRVPTMRQSGQYAYLDAEGFQAIRLPYGESENFGMVLALPDEERSLDEFKRQHLPKFEQWSRNLSKSEGSIELPRFKLKDKLQLNDALSELGMPDAFDPAKAELGGLAASGAAPGENYVSFVTQDSFVEVNEEGTEAAAVTSIGDAGGAPPPAKPFDLKLNRPFFFAIADKTTGLIVFMGEVGDPSQD